MTAVQAPTFYVKVKPVGDEAVRLDLGQRLLSLEYEDSERKADRFRVLVDNWDLAHFDDPIFKKGNELEVSWGYDGNLSPPRQCVITKISGFQQLEVEALDKGVLLHKKSRQETYTNMTRAEVAQVIAERNGYGFDQQFIQPTSARLGEVRQARLTDAQMLRRLANLEGFEWYIDFDGFHFHTRVMEQPPYRTFTWYNATDNRGGVLSIDVQNDVYAKPGRVTVKAIDPDTKQVVEGVGDNEETARKGTGEKAELFTLDIDVHDNLEISKVQAAEWERPAAVQGETGSDEVKTQADRRFRKATQTAVKMGMTVIGDPSLIAKTVVRVEGVGKRLTGNYYIKTARHNVSAAGYVTELELVSDGTRGYVRVSDVLDDDAQKQKMKAKEEPDSGADVNDKEGTGATKDEEDIEALLIELNAFDELTFKPDQKQRQNLPSEAM